MKKGLGIHILGEFYGCDYDHLNDHEFIKRAVEEAAEKAGATLLSSFAHPFSPHGATAVVVIAESHLSIHTWPEYGYAAVDVFTCGETVDPYVAFDYLKEKLQASSVKIKEIIRGKVPETAYSYNYSKNS